MVRETREERESKREKERKRVSTKTKNYVYHSWLHHADGQHIKRIKKESR